MGGGTSGGMLRKPWLARAGTSPAVRAPSAPESVERTSWSVSKLQEQIVIAEWFGGRLLASGSMQSLGGEGRHGDVKSINVGDVKDHAPPSRTSLCLRPTRAQWQVRMRVLVTSEDRAFSLSTRRRQPSSHSRTLRQVSHH